MQKEIKDKVFYLLSDLEKNSPLSVEQFDKIISDFDFAFPYEYVETMRSFNGGEGGVGQVSWLNLFRITELRKINEAYNKVLMEDIPDYFLIGKDAADTGYAFHKTYGTFHSFGLMSNFETDPIEFLGHDFVGFLEYLDNQV